MREIHSSKILSAGCLAFIVGILVTNWWSLENIIGYAIFLIALVLTFWLRRHGQLALILIIISGGFLGLWRAGLEQKNFNIDDLAHFNDRDVEITGWLAQEPDVRIDHQRIVVGAQKIKFDDKSYSVSGKFLVKTKLYPGYDYGDQLKVIGRLQAPPEVDGFDYERYLARYNIYSVMYSPRIYFNGGIDSVSASLGKRARFQILRFKKQIAARINNGLPEPQASILSAMLLGNRRGIPDDLLDKFSQTGTSHMIAISGMHIGIISAILMSLLIGMGLRRQIAFVVAAVFLFLFIIMVGAPASAVRAGMMGFMALLALNLGRLNKSINALLLVAVIMLLINPKLLLADIGFQLSFAAVLGLIYILPFFEKLLSRMPSALGIREAIGMTLAAQVTTLPLILFYFGKLSLIAPLANVLVVPILPFILIGGIVAALISLIHIPLAQFVFLPVWLLISVTIKIVEIMARLPGAYFAVNDFSLLFLVVSYGLIGYWVIYGNWIERKMNNSLEPIRQAQGRPMIRLIK